MRWDGGWGMLARVVFFLAMLPIGFAVGAAISVAALVVIGALFTALVGSNSGDFFGPFLSAAYLGAGAIAAYFLLRLERDSHAFRLKRAFGLSPAYARVANRAFGAAWAILAIFSLSLGSILAYQVFDGRIPENEIDFTLAYVRLSYDFTLFLFDNFLKVLFFDFFDIFEAELSPIRPVTMPEKLGTFVLRLALSLTITKYVVDAVVIRTPREAPATAAS
ncbi:MAG: hypothetical protein AAF909_10475 [Pseudomonadota bacterium]